MVSKDNSTPENVAQPFAAEAPPPYAAGQSSAGPSSQSRRTNMVSIERHHGGIKANYIIDPTVVIPEALLPPLGPHRTRKNVSLVAQHDGVDADITIPPVETEKDKKITLYMMSHHGGVKCQIRRTTSTPAFILEATWQHGGVKLILPRSFCGLVTAKRGHGNLHLSDGISSEQTLFSDVQGESKFFIGDTSSFMEQEGQNWEGDEMIIHGQHGDLSFVFDDEYENQQQSEAKEAKMTGTKSS